MSNTGILNCGFCEVKTERITSNNGSCIAKIIGKEELRICKLCNGLEIGIRLGLNLDKTFKWWFERQHPMSKYIIQRNGYDKYFLIKETI